MLILASCYLFRLGFPHPPSELKHYRHRIIIPLPLKEQVSTTKRPGTPLRSPPPGFYLEIFLWGEARHFNQRTSYVTNMQLLSIKHHKRRINTLFRLKLCMTFTVKFYDVLLLCSDSNVLPSSPILIQSLVLTSFMLLKLRSTVAVVTGRTAKIIAISTG